MSVRWLPIALVLLACDKPQAAPAPTPEPAPAPVAPTPPAPAVAAIPEADVMALLARWVEAQNSGDFAAYEPLYAARFLGIKRAGERVTNFHRETWLGDRKRMFSKPMKVEASEPFVRATGESAELTFTQHWSSGTFSDVGPKRLLVVREAGALKIAHEELLHSQLVEQTSKTVDVHFTLALPSGLYLVLPEAKAPEKHGAITSEGASETMYTHTAQVDEAQLPAAATGWKKRKVRLDDGCIAEVESFVLLSRVEPHFGTVQAWKGDDEHKPLTPAQIAQEAFALTEPQVAAKLSGCKQGVIAQREEASAPVAGERVSDDALLAKARAAFIKLPSVQALQKRHLKEAEDPSGVWWESSLKAEAFKHPASGQTLLSVQADNGGVCDEFAASEWVLFELRDGKLVKLRDGMAPARVNRALDLDGDGRLELLVEQPDFSTDYALVSPDRAWTEPQLTHSYQDCPC
ncbi:MAG: nuclear transport factor 2 family protein [Polyangiales bacterium]